MPRVIVPCAFPRGLWIVGLVLAVGLLFGVSVSAAASTSVYYDANDNVSIDPNPFGGFVLGTENVELGLGGLQSLSTGSANVASGYQALAQRPAGFGLLQEGVAPKAFAAVPFLVFAAPFIIMRNTLRGAKIERRRFEFVMMATVLAGFWSMMSGTFFLMTLRAAGLLA